MEVLPFIILVSLVLIAVVAWLFVWAVKSEQYEDLDGAAWHILEEDQPKRGQVVAKPDDEGSEPKA